MRVLRDARRRRAATLILFGLGLAALQSDLVALSSDSATYGSFDIGSGTFSPPPPPAHKAEVATRTSSSGPCGAYSDDLAFGPFGDDFDLATGASSTFAGYQDVCARNGGNVTADLYVSFDPRTFTALESACSPGELEAGDTTCGGTTDAGELDEILSLRLTSLSLSSTSCTAVPGTVIDVPFDSAATMPVKLADDLLPGYECAFDFTPVLRSGVTDSQKVLAQSDRIAWQLVFTVQDA